MVRIHCCNRFLKFDVGRVGKKNENGRQRSWIDEGYVGGTLVTEWFFKIIDEIDNIETTFIVGRSKVADNFETLC
jgi:hypothetical protein